MKVHSLVIASVMLLLSVSCRTGSAEVVTETPHSIEAIPRAVIYRTNINVNDNVPVRVTAEGTKILSYPAPSDVGQFSTPVELAEGWLLDRRGGVGSDTRFLTYTYSDYSCLKEPPSVSVLIDHIIKEARVTATYQLDVSLQQALADTASINDLIRSGAVQSLPRVTIK